MERKPTDDSARRGGLRAVAAWLRRAWTGEPARSPTAEGPAGAGGRRRIGHYVLADKLGEGGMGVVYAARDERLERPVALKLMSSLARDETARRRFWREARVAASVNHPNVCQLYEIGEEAGDLFIAMELLSGEPLSARMGRGAMGVSEALPTSLEILAALQALHSRGVVHRDLKPSNVFLTPHGVKLLDFGLARPLDPGLNTAETASELTRSGMVVGTPRYMAPEQVTGEEIDARTDVFAMGAILFEMLAGRPAFEGRNVVEVLHATLYEQPPALTGSPSVNAVDRVIRRALAKRSSERLASAEVMAEELRAVEGLSDSGGSPALARALTRLVVLPFRTLRPDAETDFLSFGLPDAIATSLSGLGSLVVRSTAAAARFAKEAPDLKALAVEADVDRVVTGTLLRSGDDLRVSVQLVEAPGGTLLASHTAQASLADLFRLQDDITAHVVEALSLSLVESKPSPTPPASHDPRAYSLYLRGRELGRRYDQLEAARRLYEESLELDPEFAPAWAELGRCHRVIGKFVVATPDSSARAEAALRRSLELAPRLSIAHKVMAYLEADLGNARGALVRLLGEAGRHGNDPELFSGLVHACRYCGLLEQSLAADEEARRLDPHIHTGVEETLVMAGELERLLSLDLSGHDESVVVVALGMAGRRDEARETLAGVRERAPLPLYGSWCRALLAWLDRRPSELDEAMAELGTLKVRDDPEAIFQEGWLLCDMGEHTRGLSLLQRAVASGYQAALTLASSPAFEALRGSAAFQDLLRQAEAGRETALAAFREAKGERLLGR